MKADPLRLRRRTTPNTRDQDREARRPRVNCSNGAVNPNPSCAEPTFRRNTFRRTPRRHRRLTTGQVDQRLYGAHQLTVDLASGQDSAIVVRDLETHVGISVTAT